MWPNGKYSDSPQIPVDELERLLRSKAVLLPGTEITLTTEKAGASAGATQRWRYEGGLREYLLGSLTHDPLLPAFESSGFASADDPTFAEGEGANWVIVWTEDGAITRESYVNLIPTSAGGTHEAGLREGLFGAVRAFIDAHNYAEGSQLLPEDVFSRASFVLSAKCSTAVSRAGQGAPDEPRRREAGVFFVRPQLEFWRNHNQMTAVDWPSSSCRKPRRVRVRGRK